MTRYRRRKRSGFDFGDFTITKREILASISIVAILILFGILISNKISEYHMDNIEKYNKAVKIDSQDLFSYGMKTNIGNAFVYGDLEAIDTVGFNEIEGQYMSVKKVKERYTRHTRLVTRTRKVGKTTQTYTTTEVYYTWDEVDRWQNKCNKVKFLNIEFDYGQIYTPSESYIKTIKESSNIRYVYYGSPTKYSGTLFARLGESTVNDTQFFNNKTIDETMETLEKNPLIIMFWFFWIILICGAVFVFYYIDNDWLEE